MQNVLDIDSFPCIRQISYGICPNLATMIGKLAFIRTPIKVLVLIMDMWLCDLIYQH